MSPELRVRGVWSSLCPPARGEFSPGTDSPRGSRGDPWVSPELVVRGSTRTPLSPLSLHQDRVPPTAPDHLFLGI